MIIFLSNFYFSYYVPNKLFTYLRSSHCDVVPRCLLSVKDLGGLNGPSTSINGEIPIFFCVMINEISMKKYNNKYIFTVVYVIQSNRKLYKNIIFKLLKSHFKKQAKKIYNLEKPKVTPYFISFIMFYFFWYITIFPLWVTKI